jgi:hypothetical protein
MKGLTAGLLVGLILLGSVAAYQQALITTPVKRPAPVTTTSTTTETVTTSASPTTTIYATTTATVLAQCGAFEPVVINKTEDQGLGAHEVASPAFVMNLDSIGCVRVTYTLESDVTADYLPPGGNFSAGLAIGRYGATYYPDGQISGTYALQSHSFVISSIPSSVNISDIAVGSSFSFIYLISPLSNATGFYDYAIPYMGCEGPNNLPLAVGYDASQVNGSDFFGYVGFGCPSTPYTITSVEVANMQQKVVVLTMQP